MAYSHLSLSHGPRQGILRTSDTLFEVCQSLHVSHYDALGVNPSAFGYLFLLASSPGGAMHMQVRWGIRIYRNTERHS